MRLLLLIFSIACASRTYAQTLPEEVLTQSSSSLEWETISNDYVDLIYPTFLKEESVYLANLVEHYSQYVGKTYGIDKPKKFPLIVRGEMAVPNGFVTVGPRRSEWFSSQSFSSYVGSSEWYQTLAIHEYRHVNQFDNIKQSTVKYASYLFGDTAVMLAVAAGLQPWILEGDAVWTETKYTDAGRGRSPLFMARLKALVLSNRIPTYDEFVNGTYNNVLPNHYVWGYALVSRGYQKYGEDFWKKVFAGVAKFPHPFRLYEVFRDITGESFLDFYDGTMKELKDKWSKEADSTMVIGEYRDNTYPFKINNDLYTISSTMDTHWEIQKNGETVVEIPFIKDLYQVHMSKDHAVYAQSFSDPRFAYKGSQDLIVVDLAKKSRERITWGKRLFAPRLNQAGDRILAAEFNEKNHWILSEFNLSGERLRSVEFTNLHVLEATYLNQDEVIAIMSDLRGYKFIAKVNFSGKDSQSLLPPSRNNIFALSLNANNDVFFEAQYKGHVEIMKLNMAGDVAQCTRTKFAASAPSSDGTNLYYSEMDTNGSKIVTAPLTDCAPLPKESLVNFNYLDNSSPSDNYNKFTLQAFDDQKELRTKNSEKYTPKAYGDVTSELFIPHSWSIVGGKGIELSAKTSNYLNTLGINFMYASGGERNANLAEINFDIRKFYPVFNLNAGARKRKLEYYSNENYLEWKEYISGASILLPYSYQKNLYGFSAALGAAGNYLDTRDYAYNSAAQPASKESFVLTTTYAGFSLKKQKTQREIFSEWGLKYNISYDNAEGNKTASSNYRLTHLAEATTPGFWTNHAFRFTASQEKQKDSLSGYRFMPALASPLDYILSRGYEYKDVFSYDKLSGNYILPVLDPDFNVFGVYYLKRMTANAFFDSTHVQYSGKGETLNSYGVELELESRIARFLPLKIGTRYVHKMKDDANLGQVYFSIDVTE